MWIYFFSSPWFDIKVLYPSLHKHITDKQGQKKILLVQKAEEEILHYPWQCHQQQQMLKM